jgi:hypothetical protein
LDLACFSFDFCSKISDRPASEMASTGDRFQQTGVQQSNMVRKNSTTVQIIFSLVLNNVNYT